MKAGYRLTRRAEADLDEIRAYLSERSDDAPSRVRRAFLEALETLAAYPHAGHTRTDLAPKRFRFWNVYSWMVVYRAETPVVVVRILHAARNVRKIIQEGGTDEGDEE